MAMKVPDFVSSLFQKKSDSLQVYLSLYLDVHMVAVAFWSMDQEGTYQMLDSERSPVDVDSWDARCDTVDRLIGLLEEKTGHTEVTKAILGLPTTYLTQTGEIKKDVLTEIKSLTKTLELTPIGFVPLYQAVIFKMKKDEGVPPSVILLGVNSHAVAITIYKIGALVGLREVEKHDDIAPGVEVGLKSFTDLEVLPARMLLYGPDTVELEEMKGKLMRHQWTNRVNFMHFPKIDIISTSMIIESVSIAGASELGNETESLMEKAPEAEELMVEEEKEENGTIAAQADNTPITETPVLDAVSEEVAHAQEVISEDFAVEETAAHADANVVLVDAESLGFKKDVDVLEEDSQLEGEEELPLKRPALKLPAVDFSGLSAFFQKISFGRGSPGPRIVALSGFVVFLVMGGLGIWFLPHATVTIMEIPKVIDATETIIIDPTATIVDAEKKIVPGKKSEKSLSGEKTIPVNGKKNIGDPAKGAVTIYNKSLDEKTFKKELLSRPVPYNLLLTRIRSSHLQAKMLGR